MPEENKYYKTDNFITESQLRLKFFHVALFCFQPPMSLGIEVFTVRCTVTWLLNGSEAEGDSTLIQTSLLSSCKCP